MQRTQNAVNVSIVLSSDRCWFAYASKQQFKTVFYVSNSTIVLLSALNELTHIGFPQYYLFTSAMYLAPSWQTVRSVKLPMHHLTDIKSNVFRDKGAEPMRC